MKQKLLLIIAALAFVLSTGMAQKAEAIPSALPEFRFSTTTSMPGNRDYFNANSGWLYGGGGISGVTWQDGTISNPYAFISYDMILSSVVSDTTTTTGYFRGGSLTIEDRRNSITLLTGDINLAVLSGRGTDGSYFSFSSFTGMAYFTATGGTLQSAFSNRHNAPFGGGVMNLSIGANYRALSVSSPFDGDFYSIIYGNVAPVPEPSTFFLLCSGAVGLGYVRRRLKK